MSATVDLLRSSVATKTVGISYTQDEGRFNVMSWCCNVKLEVDSSSCKACGGKFERPTDPRDGVRWMPIFWVSPDPEYAEETNDHLHYWLAGWLNTALQEITFELNYDGKIITPAS